MVSLASTSLCLTLEESITSYHTLSLADAYIYGPQSFTTLPASPQPPLANILATALVQGGLQSGFHYTRVFSNTAFSPRRKHRAPIPLSPSNVPATFHQASTPPCVSTPSPRLSPQRPYPNLAVGFVVTSREVVGRMEAVQREMVRADPSVRQFIKPLEKLCVTLMALHLQPHQQEK